MRYLKLLLIRHAQSIGNTQARMEGQQSTPLTDLGQQQAHALSQGLLQTRNLTVSESEPTLPTHLYSSPLLRAHQTTTILAEELARRNHPLSIEVHSALQEIHPGIFQGLTWAEATAKYPALCDRLMQSLAWQPVPQAESPSEARARAQAWLNDLFAKHQPGDTVWAVSHGGLMLQMISAIIGSDRTWKLSISHTAIFEFWLTYSQLKALGKHTNQDRFNPEYSILRRFNDTTHLSQHAQTSPPNQIPYQIPHQIP